MRLLVLSTAAASSPAAMPCAGFMCKRVPFGELALVPAGIPEARSLHDQRRHRLDGKAARRAEQPRQAVLSAPGEARFPASLRLG
jgi:hypothetical protein